MSSAETPKRQRRDRALEAAHWLWETQKTELREDPNRPRSKISSTRNAADKFGVPKSTVARQLKALKSGKPHYSTGVRPGRPSRLTDVEEQMLGFHTFMLRRDKKPVSMKVVQDAADALLSRKTPPGAPISNSWVRRWLRADRARARQEALSRAHAAPPNGALVEAGIDNEDEDGDLDEDAPSEFEDTDPNLDPSGYGTSSAGFEPITSTGVQQPATEAVEAFTTSQSS
ncbi:hypothetical protein F5Y10DRAFT_266559 [Nemania abortiva]|nr:hypothetical protein F5Y10DRAFT_266559 [Nemania abortiva]